jgi:uncharacterized protein (DUF849 family)
MNSQQKRYVSLFCLIPAIAILLGSCAETKTAQCQKIFLITKKMAEESAKNRETKDIKTVLEVADAFEKASEQLKKMELKDPKLTEYQQGLAEVYQGNAETSRPRNQQRVVEIHGRLRKYHQYDKHLQNHEIDHD